MRRFIVIAMTAALAVSLLALPASAKGKPGFAGVDQPNVECLHAGQGVLKELGLFSAAARGEIDYSTLADPVNGPIFLDLEEGSNFPISTVFALHLDPATSGAFAWCR